MRCADVATALGALKARPGEPVALTDSRGAVVYTMYTALGFELKTIYGRVLPFAEPEALEVLSFMVGEVVLEPMDAARYFEENA